MIPRSSRFVGLLVLMALAEYPSVHGQSTNAAALQREMDDAKAGILKIVNQPVTRLVRQPGMRVHEFSPGWFHEGGPPPIYDRIDARTTQELIYDKLGYVTSDLNPGVVFVGTQLEFNAQLKYFYTDRTLPKKKLTEAEMLEINRLCRIIGRCQRELAPPAKATAGSDAETSGDDSEGTVMVRQPIPRSRYIVCGLGIVGVLTLYGIYRVVGRRS